MTRREKAIALLQQHAAAKQALQNLPLLEPQSPAQRLQARKDFRELRKRVRLVEQALATACLVDGSFNPFLYFRF